MLMYSITITKSRIIAYLHLRRQMEYQALLDIDTFHEALDEDVDKAIRELEEGNVIHHGYADGVKYYELSPSTLS